MAGPFDTQIGIGVKDNATAGIRSIRNEVTRMQEARERLGVQSEHKIRRAIQQTEASLNRLARSGTLSAAEMSRAQEKAAAKITRLQKEMAEAEVRSYTSRNAAREAYTALGIRSEHEIQREIQKTTAAYNRLERSGVLSATEQKRAYEQMTSTVGRLRRELGETERTQSRLVSTFKTIGGIAAGVSGAAMVLGRPIGQQREFDSELHQASNFLYRDKNSASERLSGVGTLRSHIYDAVKYGGGDRDSALAAAEVLGRSKMGISDVYGALPEVMKVSTATGANASDVASLMTSTFNFGFGGEQANAALDAATTASQHGKADVSLLAREAPRGLENAKSAGFAGQKGFADVLALYEIAASVAGSADEGATNANDLLAEMSSVNLANSASRVKINGKKLDFKSMAVKDAERGHSSLYTLERIVQSVDRNDPQMKALRRKMSAATDPEARKNLQGAIDERHGQNLGLFLHNQQSKNAFMGYERNPEQFEATSHDIEDQFSRKPGQRSTDVDYAVMQDTAAYKEQKLKTQNDKASDAAVKPVSDALGNLELKVAELAEEFPKVATAAKGAAIALTTVAAFGLIKGGTDLLTGGGKGGGLMGRLKGNAGTVTEAAEDAAEATGGKSDWLKSFRRWLLKGGSTLGGAAVNGGKSLATDGLIGNPLAMTIAGLIIPSDTVSGKNESDELARLKNYNQGVNARQTSAEALSYLQNWNGEKKTPGGQPVLQLPAQPAPVVNVNVHVDGQQLLSWFQSHVDQNARRHGA